MTKFDSSWVFWSYLLMNLVIFQCGLLDFYCKLISRFSSRDWNGGHATRSFMCNQCYRIIIIIIASFLLGIINSMVLNHHFGMKIKGILLCVTRDYVNGKNICFRTIFSSNLAPINCLHFYNGATIRNWITWQICSMPHLKFEAQ